MSRNANKLRNIIHIHEILLKETQREGEGEREREFKYLQKPTEQWEEDKIWNQKCASCKIHLASFVVMVTFSATSQ